jgi:hypothetical protein
MKLLKMVVSLFGGRKKMWVASVDENGNCMGDGHWVDMPKPKPD